MNDQGNNNTDDFEADFHLENSDLEFGKCPLCKTETFDLELINEFTVSALEASNIDVPYESVCTDCLISYSEQISHVGRLKAEQNLRRQELLEKWKSKIEIIKTGRALMSQKIYSEAQKYFEEYIKVLEAVYNNNKEGLVATQIPQEHRRQESTLMCGALCDLIYIYDQYDPGTAKLNNTCDMFANFLPFSRNQGAYLRKLKKLEGKAKNKSIIEGLLQTSKNKNESCYIATAVFENSDAVELSILRNFRDHFLKKYYLGRKFIYFYYRTSPKIARRFTYKSTFSKIIKHGLKLFCFIIDPFIAS